MATQTDVKTKQGSKNNGPIQPTASADELLVKNLPRPNSIRKAETRGDDTAKNRVEFVRPADTQGNGSGAKALHPVEFDAPQDAAPPPATALRGGSVVTAPEPGTQQRPATPRVQEPGYARPSVGIARLEGRALYFTSTADLKPGQHLEIGDHAYEIRAEESFRLRFWARSAGIVVLTILAAIGVAYLLSGETPTPIMGVVINAQTGAVIPNATVSMTDGQSVYTNQAGLYVFGSATPGQYVLAATAPGFEAQNGFIETEAGSVEQISFALSPMFADATTAAGDSAAAQAAAKAKAAQEESANSGSKSFGSVELNTDFEGYLVFVDGEIYGKNSKKVKRLNEGSHKIVLQMDGYQDYSTTVKIKARSTSTLAIAKADLTPRIDPIKRSRGHFANGKNYLDNQEWTAAIREFDQALEFESAYPEAVQYRGWAYLRAQNPTKAMVDFKQAARLYDDAKRYMDAITCTGHLIDLEPKNPDHWRRRADYHLALSDYTDAIKDYEQAVKLDKKSADNRLALAEANYAAGNFRDAAREFDRARKLAQDPSHAYVRMILSYYYAGENDDVIKKYREFTEVASPELLERLRDDPEWLRVLQIIGPEERTKN